MRRDALYDAPKSSLLGMYSFADRGQTQLWSLKSSENQLIVLLKPIPFRFLPNIGKWFRPSLK